jgi:hypothetical protein
MIAVVAVLVDQTLAPDMLDAIETAAATGQRQTLD